MSKIITKHYSNVEIEGNRSTPRTGSFEVELNGKIVFSKFKLGKFPTETQIKSWFQ
ncbi:MAG: SelT/SelW/SelH family protein [Candidatus Marinimicrobia bacterium]|nr:SelT/SelW/SelH family protein [Candidatus Neomarinimicrobiota bacterium]